MVVGDLVVDLDTVVIGTGPGGYVAAIRAAELGQKVTVIEKENFGGVCLNIGCIPSKALLTVSHKYDELKHNKIPGITTKVVDLNFEEVQKWKQTKVVNNLTKGVEGLLKKHDVEILKGTAYLLDENKIRVMGEFTGATYTFKNLIVATGSRPINIPGFELDDRILDSTGLLNIKELPKNLVIIGGGYIACELAGVYSKFGTKVTILEMQDTILGTFDKSMRGLAEKTLKKDHTIIKLGVKAKSATNLGDKVEVKYEENGVEQTIQADYVMVAVGRRPNTDDLGLDAAGVELGEKGLVKIDKQCRTTNPHIFAIGDIVPGAALAHKASYEAKVAAGVISGENIIVDYKALPEVCFTHPEIARVGLTVEQAKAKGINAKSAKFPAMANGRLLTLNQTDGFIELIYNADDGTIIGGQMAGNESSNLISEITLAIEAELTLEDIALTIHPHPSIGEIIMDAAEVGLNLPINI